VPAPKGYFDNVPGLPSTAKPEVPAPKGYFDNVPGLPNPSTLDPEEASDDDFDDPPSLTQNAPVSRPAPAAPAPAPSAPPPTGGDRPRTRTGAELDPAAPSSSFDDLEPSLPPIRFDYETRGSRPRKLLKEPRRERRGTTSSADAQTAIGKRPGNTRPGLEEAAANARKRRNKLVLGGVLATIVLGGAGGSVVLYQHHVAAEERAASIAQQLDVARASLAASDPQHWQRAVTAARHVLELDDKNPEALGIDAEALLASALEEGTEAASKISQARAVLDAATESEISTPQLVRAHALAAIAVHQPDGAIALLQPLVPPATPATPASSDGLPALYLGWARAAKGDPAAAIQAFTTATTTPATKLAALYGRGNAKLALADVEGAQHDFSAILAIAKDHIGAQVGRILAQSPSPSASQQQEAELLELLARKDLADADPRAIALAWTRTGEAALHAGRYDIARERFRKALGLVPDDLTAMTGLAETELRDGKVNEAAALTATTLFAAKDNVPAQLVQSEIEIKQNKLSLAARRLAALDSHVPPSARLERARLELLTGEIFEAQGKHDEALGAYVAGAKIARDLDLGPMLAAVHKLATMTAAAVDARNQQRADELRARSEQLFDEFAVLAEHDPRLVMTLGMAYLQGGDAAKAEPWLRRAVEAGPHDADARLQLGRALLAAGKNDEALEVLNAAMGLDGVRADISLELARTYEALGRDSDAGALYTKLLAGKDPSLELRARAGKFFTRTGAPDKAGEQGAKILAADPKNAAGFYLQGESLLAAGKLPDAKQAFQRAKDLEHNPQYLDALGRAAEALAQGGDRTFQDLALQSYLDAAAAAPATFNALAGQGRLYVARHEAAKAIPPLLAAAALEPKNAGVLFLLGAAYQELQRSTAALQSFEASVKIAPSAEAFWRIGQIYRDLNRGRSAVAAVENATRLAAEAEQRPGTQVAWLTDALYLQGRIHLDLHHDARAREAWLLYVARNPPASPQLTEVTQLLATSLRR
jgi:tetratricopeptide (TPR) repeat protein